MRRDFLKTTVHSYKQYTLYIIGVLVLCALACVYYIINPSEVHIFPRCVFLSLTGYKCAGCGLQRAIHSLLHFDLLGAIHYNLYFVLLLPWPALVFLGYLLRNRYPRLYELSTHRYLITAIITLAILWWIVRNMIGW